MNIILSLRSLAILTITTFIATSALADMNLTPDQLVLLMKASSKQYNTIDAKMRSTSYQYDTDNKTKLKLRVTQEIVSRWTTKKHFSKTVRTLYPDVIPHEGYSPTIISTYVITPKWSKRLVEAPDGRIPRGCIRPGSSLPGSSLEEELTFYPIYTAMWSFFEWPWEEMNLAEATVTFDEKQNYYIMTAKMGSDPNGPLITLYIDPFKDFIPVKKEFLKSDGTLLLRRECNDFRQTEDGLWIPYRYFWLDPEENYGGLFEVEKVTVNQVIPENLLDFNFSEGTIVYDERVKLRYTIGETRQAQQPIVDPNSLTSTGVVATSPAKDEELLASASKAKELLQAHAGVVEALPSIEVSPAIVLVIANRYEYSLSVIRPDGTKPQLLSYRFESDTLEFLSLKDLIQDKSQLIVNIGRIKSHTGFASGTLLLQFAEENNPVKVMFVSAPLPNTP